MFRNIIFVSIIIFTIIMQIMFVQFGGTFFSTTPLSGYQWAMCLLVASSIIPLGTYPTAPLRDTNSQLR